jgi:hypothetical protein
MDCTAPDFDWDYLKQLMWNHPSTCPETLTNSSRLVENPSSFAATWRLECFRTFTQQMMRDYPLDPDWPRFLTCTEAALKYRTTIPKMYRFWRDANEGLETIKH